MEHRLLGRTGVSVSKLCLGAMMFGDWGRRASPLHRLLHLSPLSDRTSSFALSDVSTARRAAARRHPPHL